MHVCVLLRKTFKAQTIAYTQKWKQKEVNARGKIWGKVSMGSSLFVVKCGEFHEKMFLGFGFFFVVAFITSFKMCHYFF